MPKPKKKPRTDAAERVARAVEKELRRHLWAVDGERSLVSFKGWGEAKLASHFVETIRRAMRPRRSKR